MDIQKTAIGLQTLADDQNAYYEDQRPDSENLRKKFIYLKSGEVREEGKDLIRTGERLGSISLGTYAQRVSALFTNPSFTTEHADQIEALENAERVGFAGASSRLNREANKFLQKKEALSTNKHSMTYLQDRVQQEISDIKTKIQAWKVFRFVIQFFYARTLSNLNKAEASCTDAIKKIDALLAEMILATPPTPVTVYENTRQIEALTADLGFEKETRATVPKGVAEDAPGIVRRPTRDFRTFLYDKELVLFNEGRKVRSLDDLEEETDAFMRTLNLPENYPDKDDLKATVRERMRGYITLEIKNYNKLVVDFLKEQYYQKFSLLEKEIAIRELHSVAISAKELTDYCSRFNALSVVYYTPPKKGAGEKFVSWIRGAIFGAAPSEESVSGYMDALIATGLGTRLSKEDLVRLNTFLIERTLDDGSGLVDLRIYEGEFNTAIIRGVDGKIVPQVLYKIIFAYLAYEGRLDYRATDATLQENDYDLTSPEGIGRAFIDFSKDFEARQMPRHSISEGEAVALLENLGYMDYLRDNPDTATRLASHLAKCIKHPSIYYGSLKDFDKIATVEFNLGMMSFLNQEVSQIRQTDRSLYNTTARAYQEKINELFDDLRFEPDPTQDAQIDDPNFDPTRGEALPTFDFGAHRIYPGKFRILLDVVQNKQVPERRRPAITREVSESDSANAPSTPRSLSPTSVFSEEGETAKIETTVNLDPSSSETDDETVVAIDLDTTEVEGDAEAQNRIDRELRDFTLSVSFF